MSLTSSDLAACLQVCIFVPHNPFPKWQNFRGEKVSERSLSKYNISRYWKSYLFLWLTSFSWSKFGYQCEPSGYRYRFYQNVDSANKYNFFAFMRANFFLFYNADQSRYNLYFHLFLLLNSYSFQVRHWLRKGLIICHPLGNRLHLSKWKLQGFWHPRC